MKKTFLTIAIILGVTFCAMAQPQGGGLINLPGSHGSTDDADDADVPYNL